ncbi:MAG: hypothetical protein R6U64_00665 [Bacteroidales bacterium]
MNQNTSSSDQGHSKFPFRVSSRNYLWIIGVFTLIGVLGGYAYYHFIGCNTGGCAITSNPYMSMLWGGAMGYLVPDFMVKKPSIEKPQ